MILLLKQSEQLYTLRYIHSIVLKDGCGAFLLMLFDVINDIKTGLLLSNNKECALPLASKTYELSSDIHWFPLPGKSGN